MHELGIVMEIVRVVDEFAKEKDITKVEAIVLQIGELSGVVPEFIKECFPAAIDGTFMEDTVLDIEIVPGNARCQNCGTVFNVVRREGRCSKCGSRDFDILGGKEFFIKEIRVPEE